MARLKLKKYRQRRVEECTPFIERAGRQSHVILTTHLTFLRSYVFSNLSILIRPGFWHWAIVNKKNCSADGESTLRRVPRVSHFQQVRDANTDEDGRPKPFAINLYCVEF